ncbi:MAG: presqualene diphosphate synthase HpnD [Bacteroidota bacterium]
MPADLATVITKQSNTSFYFSFSLLPKTQREAINTVYAFCRCTDDIVDEGTDKEQQAAILKRWRLELERSWHGYSQYPILNQLSQMAQKFKIPLEHFFELIKGMEMDLGRNRYETFDELRVYCYRVASTVGLMCTEIFGYKNENSKLYAENLGIALQLTNILRDIKADAKKGRIYIPGEDLRRFGYTEEDLFAHRYTPEFMSLMEFECARARQFYTLADSYLSAEDTPRFFAAKIMETIYLHLLKRIESSRYNVFEKKISISQLRKFAVAIRIWLQNKLTPAL